jgi:hypothetical protein
MPSTSKKQADFMRAVAHCPEFAKTAGVPTSVGKDFSNADKSRKFKEGGDMATKMNPAFKAMIEKNKAGAKPAAKGKMMAAKGKPFAKGGGIESKGKTKGTMVTMKSGGKNY